MKETICSRSAWRREQPERDGPAVAESDALKLAELALAEANQKLAGQTARADKLALENQALQSRVQALLASPDTIQALREENALLKNRLPISNRRYRTRPSRP